MEDHLLGKKKDEKAYPEIIPGQASLKESR